jgi:protein-disulfide isomerase
MSTEELESNSIDIYTIFTYRYIFDRKNDIVNLSLDIDELRQFPERLFASYKAEWESYNQKAARKLDIELSAENAQAIVSNLSAKQQNELREYLQAIERAIAINESPNIKVIKTELRSYLEFLIKL